MQAPEVQSDTFKVFLTVWLNCFREKLENMTFFILKIKGFRMSLVSILGSTIFMSKNKEKNERDLSHVRLKIFETFRREKKHHLPTTHWKASDVR